MAKTIGNRIVWSEKNGEIVFSINARIDRWKETLLLTWLLAWSIIGGYMFIQLFGDYDRETKLFFFVYMFFWAYFEYKVVYAFIWRKWGTEMVKVDGESIQLKKDINGYGKVGTYYFENIKDLHVLEYGEKSFAKTYADSFWVVGGERLVFRYMGKKVSFGMQLNGKDARELFKVIKSRMSKK